MSSDRNNHTPLSNFINLLFCGGLITIIAFGSICLTTDNLCGPAGRTGGIAMVSVGSVLLGVQILVAICFCCIGVTALLAFGDNTPTIPTPSNLSSMFNNN